MRWYIFLTVLIWSCDTPESPDCFKSAGDELSITRPINNIKAIVLDDYVDVKVIQDSGSYVRITGPENLLDKIITLNEAHTLTIRNENTCNWVRSYGFRLEVEVHLSRLERIILNDGSGNVWSEGKLELDSLFIETNHASGDLDLSIDSRVLVLQFHTGTCEAKFEGEVDRLEMYSDAFGEMDAGALLAEQAFVNNSSINDMTLRATGYAYIAINDKGNVYLGGDPAQLVSEITGSGQLILLD